MTARCFHRLFVFARDIQGQAILAVGVLAAPAGQAALGQLQRPAGGDAPSVQLDGGQLPVAYHDGQAAIQAGEIVTGSKSTSPNSIRIRWPCGETTVHRAAGGYTCGSWYPSRRG